MWFSEKYKTTLVLELSNKDDLISILPNWSYYAFNLERTPLEWESTVKNIATIDRQRDLTKLQNLDDVKLHQASTWTLFEQRSGSPSTVLSSTVSDKFFGDYD